MLLGEGRVVGEYGGVALFSGSLLLNRYFRPVKCSMDL